MFDAKRFRVWFRENIPFILAMAVVCFVVGSAIASATGVFEESLKSKSRLSLGVADFPLQTGWSIRPALSVALPLDAAATNFDVFVLRDPDGREWIVTLTMRGMTVTPYDHGAWDAEETPRRQEKNR